MILAFLDQEGDPIAIESANIMAVSIGKLNGPRTADDNGIVTLIWTVGGPVNRPFMTRQPFAEVLEAWTAARESGGTPGRPGYHGWPVNWWDAAAPPPWAPKGGWPK